MPGDDDITGALFIKAKNEILHPVIFISRLFMHSEKKYSVLDKKPLAIYWSAKNVQQFLMRQGFFTQTDLKVFFVQTDHKYGTTMKHILSFYHMKYIL